MHIPVQIDSSLFPEWIAADPSPQVGIVCSERSKDRIFDYPMTREPEIKILSSLDSGSGSPEVVIVFGDQIAVGVGNVSERPQMVRAKIVLAVACGLPERPIIIGPSETLLAPSHNTCLSAITVPEEFFWVCT